MLNHIDRIDGALKIMIFLCKVILIVICFIFEKHYSYSFIKA